MGRPALYVDGTMGFGLGLCEKEKSNRASFLAGWNVSSFLKILPWDLEWTSKLWAKANPSLAIFDRHVVMEMRKLAKEFRRCLLMGGEVWGHSRRWERYHCHWYPFIFLLHPPAEAFAWDLKWEIPVLPWSLSLVSINTCTHMGVRTERQTDR